VLMAQMRSCVTPPTSHVFALAKPIAPSTLRGEWGALVGYLHNTSAFATCSASLAPFIFDLGLCDLVESWSFLRRVIAAPFT
jgi:hypothetical protein